MPNSAIAASGKSTSASRPVNLLIQEKTNALLAKLEPFLHRAAQGLAPADPEVAALLAQIKALESNDLGSYSIEDPAEWVAKP